MALVPPGVVTVTCAGPVAPAGATKDSDVAALTTSEVPAAVPTLTEVAPVRLVPVTVTTVPPLVLAVAESTLVMVGGGALKVNLSAATAALVPTGLVTETSTTPGLGCAGT